MSTVIPALPVANAAKADAQRTRAAALVAVARGDKSIHDIIREATTDDGRPLLRITLRQLLLSQPGWGEQRTTAALRKLLGVLGKADLPFRKTTLSWLLDVRAGGRRFMTFCDVLSTKESAPWPGFPFAAKPRLTPGGVR